ncbi:MAG: hypothetical protein E6J41_12110 [Chloroflexi bacterium]|nr:MAG: hypothetical protein E6J41_12110 [Chloroflexota bacterium]
MRTMALMVLASATLLGGCAGIDTAPAAARTASPPAVATTTPSARPAASPGARPTPAAGDPASLVGRSVPASRQRLLPGWTPAGMAPVTTLENGGYIVVYADDLHTKEVYFTDEFGVNPPPQTSPHAVSAMRQFRGARATYVIYDGSAPTSQRYLTWDEPGQWPTGEYGMPTNQFYLEAHGLTESEFFRVADSLQLVA